MPLEDLYRETLEQAILINPDYVHELLNEDVAIGAVDLQRYNARHKTHITTGKDMAAHSPHGMRIVMNKLQGMIDRMRQTSFDLDTYS